MQATDPNHITFFAKTNFRNREVPFGIKADDRRRHMYVIGKTGMGKTTMLENMVIQDIRNGHGVCFIDPHGDSVAKILNFIPTERINDVIYFNPSDLDFPIAFNILEAVDSKYKHLVASGLMGVFTKIWANLWSARMEYILNNTILALLDSPGNTMLGITRMYVDKKYRKRIIDNIKDPMVRAFWVDEWANLNEKYRTEAVAPIQNKVGQFLSSAVIRNIVGQPKSTVDLRDIMDNRKILLMDLSKGKVGEDNSALLGAMIITKLQLAALSRVDIADEANRPDFYLYVDEFQNFATESFATILSEARKYHLNLVIGHQYIGQLTTDRNNTRLRDAIFGNVGTIVCFRVGAADAEFLETEFTPLYTPQDLVNVPKYNIIIKLMINGVSSDPFSAVTTQVHPDWKAGSAAKVIKVSRERYANEVSTVEAKISRWMGTEFHEQSALLAGGTDEEEGGNQPREVVRPAPQPVLKPTEHTPREETPLSLSEAEPDTKPAAPVKIEVAEAPALARARSLAARLPEVQRSPRMEPGNGQLGNRPPSKDRFPERRFTNRPQRSQQNRQQHNRPKSAPKQNPIWDTVATLNQEKIKTPSVSSPPTVQPGPQQNVGTHPVRKEAPVQIQPAAAEAKQPLQPGQVHKF